jgi:hypothetical protein
MNKVDEIKNSDLFFLFFDFFVLFVAKSFPL